jgi:hypothetical protein
MRYSIPKPTIASPRKEQSTFSVAGIDLEVYNARLFHIMKTLAEL